MQALVGRATPGGFILRTNAEEASDTELADDIAYLRKTWARSASARCSTPPGTLLHQDLSLAERVLRDLANDATQTIRIDSQLQYDTLRAFGETYTPGSGGQARALHAASGRSSTSSASRKRSCARWRGGSS